MKIELDKPFPSNYIYQYILINLKLLKIGKRVPIWPSLAGSRNEPDLSVISNLTKEVRTVEADVAVAKERSFLASLPTAIWSLSLAIMAMRIAEVFYVPILDHRPASALRKKRRPINLWGKSTMEEGFQ